MANSSVVQPNDAVLAIQYNNLRLDILDSSTGHVHTGAADGGQKVSHANLDAGTVTADQHHTGFVGLLDGSDQTISPDANDLVKVYPGNAILTCVKDGTSLKITVLQGNIDHGSLSGLGDDDHPQYGEIAQTETISGIWTHENPLFTEYLKHAGDLDTFFRFQDNNITMDVGGKTAFYLDDIITNVFLGTEAGFSNSTGTELIYIGDRAGYTGVDEDGNVAIGVDAMRLAKASSCVAIGYSALEDAGTTSGGDGNTAVGSLALQNMDTGTDNVAIGANAMWVSVSGSRNVAIGEEAMHDGIGNDNIAIGHHCMTETGAASQYNIGIGENAMVYNGAGDHNIGIGHQALLYNNDGNYNVAIGGQAGYGNAAAGGGAYSNNVLIGYQAGYGLAVAGNDNVAIGYQAGLALTTGSANVFVGNLAGSQETTGSNKLFIDNTNTATPLIYGEFDNDMVVVYGWLGIGVIPLAPLHVYDVVDEAELTVAIFEGLRATPAIGDTIFVDYRLSNDAPAGTEYARTTITAESIGSGTETGSLLFEVKRAGALEVALKMAPDEIVVNEDGTDRNFRIETLVGSDTFTINGLTGRIGIGSSPGANAGVSFNSPAQTIDANENFRRVRVRNAGALTIPTGSTSAYISSLSITEPNIVLAGTGAVTTASTLRIIDAPTEGTYNYALLVDAGASRLEGDLTVTAGLNIGTATGAGTGDVALSDDILLADGAVVGIAGNEVITFQAAGTIDFTGANVTMDNDLTVTNDILLSDGSVIGITGNEVITFNAAGTIAITGADILTGSEDGGGKLNFDEGTTLAMGIAWGSDANKVTLYRSADDILKTDDSLTVAVGLNVGTATGAGIGGINAAGTLSLIYTSGTAGTGQFLASGSTGSDTRLGLQENLTTEFTIMHDASESEFQIRDGGWAGTVVLSIDDGVNAINVLNDLNVGNDVLLVSGAVVGIAGNEIITFDAAGTIVVSGAMFGIGGTPSVRLQVVGATSGASETVATLNAAPNGAGEYIELLFDSTWADRGETAIRATVGAIVTDTDMVFMVDTGAGRYEAMRIKGQQGDVQPGGNKTQDMGISGLAWDDCWADDFQNEPDYYYMDKRKTEDGELVGIDDLAVLRGILPSGEYDERTGMPLIDDATLPQWMLTRDKHTGETLYGPDGKPWLSSKMTTSLSWGAIRQMDAEIIALRRRVADLEMALAG